MIIIVTGMVGIDKKAYLAEVCELARQRGKDVQLYSIGDMMYAEAQDVAPGRILDIPRGRLDSLRRSVFKDIIAKAKSHDCLIVNTHATFRWRHGLFPAFDFYQMQQLNPDMFICLLDGVEHLHLRLTNDHNIQHTLKDLMVWREEELLATEMMRQGVNAQAPFYQLVRGTGQGTVETFYQLLFEPQRKTVYLSFPMTHVANIPSALAEIDAFRAELKKMFTCFDPADLEETGLPYRAEQAAKEGKKGFELEALGQKFCLEVEEIRGILRDINTQIYARDFALIDQAQMIISFIPELPDGMPALSSGVERELQHAHEAAKSVYVIWKPKKEPSVFVTETATKVFRSTEELLAFFAKKAPKANSSTKHKRTQLFEE
jgi:adenylate kinase